MPQHPLRWHICVKEPADRRPLAVQERDDEELLALAAMSDDDAAAAAASNGSADVLDNDAIETAVNATPALQPAATAAAHEARPEGARAQVMQAQSRATRAVSTRLHSRRILSCHLTGPGCCADAWATHITALLMSSA